LPSAGLTTVLALKVSGTNLFAGTYGGGVFLSTNNGTNWTAVNTGLTNTNVYALALNGTNLFAGTLGGVFLSTNNGTSWAQVNSGLTNTGVYALASYGSTVFAGTNGGGVFLSTNNGTNWTAINTNLTTMSVYALTVSPASSGSGPNLFAGTYAGGVWRRPLSELVSVHEAIGDELPRAVSLAQNYPNPFNPTTIISYQLPSSNYVVLKIYDLLGRETATLVDGTQSAGTHALTFDAAHLPSGIYFYTLHAGTFNATKKLVLLK
jgi:hypothetical protein